MSTRDHWEDVYGRKVLDEVSWYQERPERSLAWIEALVPERDAPLIDVGAGASRLIDHLLDAGYSRVIALDIAGQALEATRKRLGQERAAEVDWIVANVLELEPPHPLRLWHDRAVLHFLTDAADRRRYAEIVRRAVEPGGFVVIANFAHGGPDRCSGLPVVQADCAELGQLLGDEFTCVRNEREAHRTPSGGTQDFQYCAFQRSQGG